MVKGKRRSAAILYTFPIKKSGYKYDYIKSYSHPVRYEQPWKSLYFCSIFIVSFKGRQAAAFVDFMQKIPVIGRAVLFEHSGFYALCV
jgi:hypothetical protein